MQDMFRFTVVRPAEGSQAADVDSVVTDSPLQGQLAAASAQGPAAVVQAATAAAANDPAIADPLALPEAANLLRLHAQLMALPQPTAAQCQAAVQVVFGEPADAVAQRQGLADTRRALADALVMLKLISRDTRKTAETIERLFRTVTLIPRIAAGIGQNARAVLTRHFQRPLRAPAFVRLVGDVQANAPNRTARRQRLRDLSKGETRLRTEYADIRAALHELLSIGAKGLRAPAALAAGGNPRPARRRERGLLRRALKRIGGVRRADVGKPVDPNAAAPIQPQLGDAAIAALTATTRRVLNRIGIVPAAASVGQTVTLLRARAVNIDERVRRLRAQQVALGAKMLGIRNVAMLGNTFIRSYAGNVLDILIEKWAGDDGNTPAPLAGVPTTHGTVQPAGIADLLVVKQTLKKYEPLEVAHIENILDGETKDRQHRRSRTTEEFFLQETETTEQEERDLQTTERFELQRESSRTIKEEASLKAGVSVSGKYGPSTDYKAYADGAVSGSKEESKKQAATFAKEITERSALKITERVRTERTRRVIEQFEESNRHQLANPAGNGHIRGVYQWVDKIYEAQVWNYGIRTLYDFVVPEPAAVYAAALKGNIAEQSGLEAPVPFSASPSDITEDNYQGFVALYGASGVEPPADPFVTKGQPVSGASDDDDEEIPPKEYEIAIPDGYEAYYASVVENSHVAWDGDDSQVDIAIGERTYRFTFTNSSYWNTPLDGEIDSIGIVVTTFGIKSFSLSVQLQFKRTSRAFENWQNSTHTAIQQAYLAKQSSYEAELSNAQVAQQGTIAGRNPTENRSIERAELKRACVSVLTAQHFDHFGAIANGAYDLPELNLAEVGVEGPYIKFFEQAFEWEQITYLFYPYFWGRKSEWVERLSISDSDPLFAEFLKAGAARVVIPVREGFEAAVAHFMETGARWAGGDVPGVNSELYLGIIDEIKERQQAPLGETKHGDPWDVRVPTTTVLVRDDNALPQFQQDANGNWVPV